MRKIINDIKVDEKDLIFLHSKLKLEFAIFIAWFFKDISKIIICF
jgi:hypothetical protein